MQNTFKMAIVAIATFSAFGISHAQQSAVKSNGVVSPPPPVTNVISVDAHNNLLVETQEQTDAPKEYSLAIPKHLYSGGIARLFGGTVIPTEVLVIPESALRSGAGNTGFSGGNSNNGNNSGNNNFGGNTFNRGFGQYSPRVPIRTLNDFNQAFGALDRLVRQTQIGGN